jgi:hypothetical protein
MAGEGEPFTLPVYAAEHVLADGYRPWAGDIVQGRLWLQGGLPKGQGAVAITVSPSSMILRRPWRSESGP